MAAPIDKNKVFVREIETNNRKTIRINQYSIGDVGCVVWDAAIVLSKYLETEDFNYGKLWKNKNVVELGAGTGVVGLVAAAYESKVIVTDLEEFVPLMQMNIDENKEQFTSTVTARTLKWGGDIVDDEFNKIDIILVADCIYYEESLEPLVKTMVSLCGESTCIYCCYEERTTGNKPELQKKFFKIWPASREKGPSALFKIVDRCSTKLIVSQPSVPSCQVIYHWKYHSKTFPMINHMAGLDKIGKRYFKQ